MLETAVNFIHGNKNKSSKDNDQLYWYLCKAFFISNTNNKQSTAVKQARETHFIFKGLKKNMHRPVVVGFGRLTISTAASEQIVIWFVSAEMVYTSGKQIGSIIWQL